MHRPRIVSLSLIVMINIICVSLTGCSFTINATAERVARTYTKQFDLKINRIDPFMSCIETPGGMCPLSDLEDAHDRSFFAGESGPARVPRAFSTATDKPNLDLNDASLLPAERGARQANLLAADLARDVLNHPVQAQLNALYSVVKGANPSPVKKDDKSDISLFESSIDSTGNTDATIDISLDKFEEYQEAIEAATLLGGWDALANEADLLSDSSVDSDGVRTRAYIEHYFRAYFREGKFFKATIDGSELKNKIIARLEERIPGHEDYETLAKELFPQFGFDPEKTEYVFGRIEDSGFVSRGGQKLSFPAVEASFSLGSSEYTRTDVDYISVGSDLIRVLLHAVYDSDMRLPSVSNASGLTVADDMSLMVNDPSVTNVDENEFERVQTRATQMEGVISAATGRIIRGVSFLSLNNEALATAIETAIGLAVKKQIEKVVWCWYACQFDQIDSDVGDFAATSFGDDVSLKITVSGLPDENFAIHGTAERKR